MLSRIPHMECSLVPECKLEDEKNCEIKDVIVTVQVQCTYVHGTIRILAQGYCVERGLFTNNVITRKGVGYS